MRYVALVAVTIPARPSRDVALGLLLDSTTTVIAPLLVYWPLCVAALTLNVGSTLERSAFSRLPARPVTRLLTTFPMTS